MSNNLIISYLSLRKLIGILGMVLAFICMLGGLIFSKGTIVDSISAYYHTAMRDVMVSTLAVAGAFLLTYKGYDRTDRVLSTVAGVTAIFTALFPCYCGDIQGRLSFMQIDPVISGVIHFASAAIFFAVLGYMSLFQFTKSGSKDLSDKKKKRNKVYRICGIMIFVAMAFISLYKLFIPDEVVAKIYLTLWMEAIMLNAFGVSWMVKGQALFPD